MDKDFLGSHLPVDLKVKLIGEYGDCEIKAVDLQPPGLHYKVNGCREFIHSRSLKRELVDPVHIQNTLSTYLRQRAIWRIVLCL